MRPRGRTRGKPNHGAGSKEHQSDRQMSPALLQVLNHPIRREILRLLRKRVELSPAQMTKAIDVGLPTLAFHARALKERGVIRCTRTRQARGSIEHFYASNVAKNRLVATILRKTQEDDGFLRR